MEHTGANIGQWIEDVHSEVKCVPNFIGSHTVDGAANAGLVVEKLKWNTGDQRTTKIVSLKCDAHQINITGKRLSGTSSHKVNYNPVLGTSLTLLHATLNRVTNSATQMKVYRDIQKVNRRKKFPALATAVKTRWNSEHKEADIVAANMEDLSIALGRMICL